MHERTCSTPGCGKRTRSPGATVCSTCHSRSRKGQPLLLGPTDCCQCGEPFTPARLGVKFCSEPCAYRHKKIDEARRLRERSALTRFTNCLTCSVDITHRNNKAKFCSQHCCNSYIRNTDDFRARRRAEYVANLEVERERARQYVARYPERSAAAKLAYRLRNTDAIRDRAKVNRKNWDPDGSKGRLREQNRRARKLGNPESVGVSARDWERMIRIHSGRCAYCGERPGKLTLDHVIPLAKGGRHAIGNAVPACGWCNSSKSGRFLAVWRYKYLPLRRRGVDEWTAAGKPGSIEAFMA